MPRKKSTLTSPRCTVRMYCHGLGDCFLVKIMPVEGGKPFWLMIDAGILLGSPSSNERMRQVFESITKATGGEIDLLVVTHQHWDHVSGFSQAQDELKKLKIKKVWYAWTEDPQDALGVELQRTRSKAAFAIEEAVSKLGPKSNLGLAVAELMGAFGVGKSGSLSTAEAMKLPGQLFPTEYRRPGETVELGGVRFHILGPPRDERIFRSDPSKKDPEVYSSKVKAFGLGASMGMTEAVMGMRSEDPGDLTKPFDSRHCRRLDDVQDAYQNYIEAGAEWRKIDEDWQEVIGQLALQLDSDTNNTSLAFAIEIPETGKVLVFAADAQVGNWLSWHDQRWTVKEGGLEKQLSASDLLGRAVLYKVGHHGSHNATLRDKGLELMISPELCAMIPVEVATAKKKKWLEMPLETLVTRLGEKTKGRVAKADDPATFKPPFRAAPDSERNEFGDPPRPLWVELDVS